MGRKIGNSAVTIKNLRIDKKKSGTYVYHRKTGARLPDVNSPEFLQAYVTEEAKIGKPKRKGKAGSITAAINIVKRDDEYLGLSAPYRRMLARNFDAIEEQFGDLAFKGARPEHIRKNVAEADSPQDRLKSWRFLCSHSDLAIDPSIGVKAPKRPSTTGHPTWTEDEIETFRAKHKIGSVTRACFELLYWTGCRISDAVRIGPQHIDRQGVLSFVQEKTGDDAFVPWTCALPAYAEDMERDRKLMHDAIETTRHDLIFLATAQGKPRSSKALGNMLRAAAHDIGIEKSAHGLRKARAVSLVDAGATTHQVAAWTGHQTLKEVERYTKKANRRRAVMGENKNGTL